MNEDILKTAQSLGIDTANKTEDQLRAEISQRMPKNAVGRDAIGVADGVARPAITEDPAARGESDSVVDALTKRYLDMLDSADIQAQRRAAEANPEYAAYSGQANIGMSKADRDKLEAEAAQAGVSVEDYTGMSGLDRMRARNGEAPAAPVVSANGTRSVGETRTVAQVEAAERVRNQYAERQQGSGSGSMSYPTSPNPSSPKPAETAGASQLAYEGKPSDTVQVSQERSDRYNSQGYAGSTFTGSEINSTARQLPGGSTLSPFAQKVVTDASGRVVGSSTNNPASRIVSQLAGIPAVAPDQSPAPAAKPAGSPMQTGSRTEPLTRQKAREMEQAERSAISRSLAVSEWNRGDSSAQRALTNATTALAPGGASTATVDYNSVRDKVNAALTSKPDPSLPKATQDRFNQRAQALPGQVEKREREQRVARRLAAR